MEKYVLAIDLGTSSVKTALISAKGQMLTRCSAPLTLILHPGGGAEQNPEEWWEAIRLCIKKMVTDADVASGQVVAIACTGQWSGTVAVDQQGRPLMNALIWMDSRGAPYVRQITGGLIELLGYHPWRLQKWVRLTGGIPSASGKGPIGHILYIKHERPEIYAATYKFLEPKDYLNLLFTGQFSTAVDAIALHWVADVRDLTQAKYNKDLLQMATVEREKLPDIKPATDIVGGLKAELAGELGLETGTPVVMGTPDLHSGLLGSGAVDDFAGNLHLGSSSWVTCHIPFKKIDPFHNMTSMPAAIPERYFVINEQESACACLTYLRDAVFYPQDGLDPTPPPADFYERCDQLVATAPAGSNNLIFTPWLYGERTPVEEHTLRAGFHNLSLDHNRAHMVRAVFEGVAFNMKWLMGCVEGFIKRPFVDLATIGGGAKSAVWCQIFADILERPIKQLKDPVSANLYGVAMLAWVILGEQTFTEMAQAVQIEKVFTPQSDNRTRYRQLYQEFGTIYKSNRRIYARLNGEGP